jgi:hypothetical protein
MLLSLHAEIRGLLLWFSDNPVQGLKEDGRLVAGGYLLYISIFTRNGANFCKLLQTEDNDADMKKKIRIFNSAPTLSVKWASYYVL